MYFNLNFKVDEGICCIVQTYMHKCSDLPFTSFSAPETSRAIISRGKITKFNRRDQRTSMDTKDGIDKPQENSSTPSRTG